MIEWVHVHTEEGLEAAIAMSSSCPVLFFKHSSRCAISSMVLRRLERNWEEGETLRPFFVDVIHNRSISMRLAEIMSVRHESPQALIIDNKTCIYQVSHNAIRYNNLLKACLEASNRS